MPGRFARWVARARIPLEARVNGAVVAPGLDDIFLAPGGPVSRVRLAAGWAGHAWDPTPGPIPRLLAHGAYRCPLVPLGGGRIALDQGHETAVFDADTGEETARFPATGSVSADGLACASVVTRTVVEHAYSSSLDWTADWTRDGDDLSERPVTRYEGIALHFARGHARHGERITLPLRERYAARWRGTDALIAWCNDAIDVCEIAAPRPRAIARAHWVISAISVAPAGRFVVGAPPGRPVTIWDTTGERPVRELPELGVEGLLRVTDGGVVSSWRGEAGGATIFDADAGRALPFLAIPTDTIAWELDAEGRRAVVVGPSETTLFERP